jgi:hypothetical protein
MSLSSEALLQARFSLNFSVAWRDCFIEVLNNCLFTAVTSDNMNLFVSLKKLVLQKCKNIDFHETVIAAA